MMSVLRPTLTLLGVVALTAAREADPGATRPAVVTQTAPAEVHPALVALRRADADFDRACSGAFEIAVPARASPGPDLGKHAEACRFSTAAGIRALLLETRYEHDPEFRPQGQGGLAAMDYDGDGNLIVWRRVRKSGLSTPELNRTLDEQEVLLIAPNGEVLNRLQNSMLWLYDIGSPDSTYELDQFRLATGRGLAAYLQSVNSAEVRSDGLEELRCAGNYGPAMTGEWRLVVDVEAGYLVREARLLREDPDWPVVRVQSSGLFRREGITLAADGVLTYARRPGDDFELAITVRDLAARADDRLVEQFRTRLTVPLPDNAVIIDERRGASKVYHSGEAPADLPDIRRPPTK